MSTNPSDYLYDRMGPWPQPNPAMDLWAAVVHLPKDELRRYQWNIGLRYMSQLVLYTPAALWYAWTNPGLAPLDDAEFADRMCVRAFSKFLYQAKRGDIENTTELYAQAFLDELGFDSITVQPYMGQDSARPFLRRKNKFVWILALTSNYGANDFQFLKVGNQPLWEIVVEKAISWNEHKTGFVFGASHTKEISKMTKQLPEVPLLIPGIGAQKGSLEKTINSLNHNLFVINQSRSIIYAAPKAENAEEFKSIVGEAAMKARDEINGFLMIKK